MKSRVTPRRCGAFFTVQNGTLLHGNEAAPFFNGMNVAWINWQDFAIGPADPRGTATYCGFEESVRFLVANHGNALRVWLFTEPAEQIQWNSQDRPTGLADGVILGVRTLLELALHYRVHVVLVLFNGALARDDLSCSLFGANESIMLSLLESVVQPLAQAVKGYESLAMSTTASIELTLHCDELNQLRPRDDTLSSQARLSIYSYPARLVLDSRGSRGRQRARRFAESRGIVTRGSFRRRSTLHRHERYFQLCRAS